MKKKKRRLLLLIPILLVIIILFIIILSNKVPYKKEVVKVFKEENIYDVIKDNKKYSKTLEEAILQNKYKKDYLLEYLNINYIEDDNFLDNINKLLDIGYKSNDINNIYSKIPNSVNILLDNSYDENISNYLKLNYFKEDYLDRYLKYAVNAKELKSVYDVTNIIDNYSYEDTVTFVNANLDKKYYTNDIEVTDEEAYKIDVLVNKYHKLSSTFEPNDLEEINKDYSMGKQRLRKEAKEKFEEMCSDALKENIKIYAGSTYRSFSYQEGLYNRYVKQDGFDKAETYSARAGYSEHQLGLAIDIANGKWNFLSEDDIEYSYLIDNSYKYGFILRYPRGKEYVTGYMFEDWHFRYLGVELATKVHNSKLTYDEYVARNM